jgi:hypothetical protein
MKRKLDATGTVPQSSSSSILLNQSLNSEACSEPDQSHALNCCSLKISEEDVAATIIPQSCSSTLLNQLPLNAEACNEPDQSSGSYCSLKMSEEDDVAAWIKGPESIKKDEVHSQLAAADSKMVKDSCVNGIVEQGANVNSGHKAECMIKAVQAGMKDVTVKVLASSQVTDVSLMGFKDTSTNVTDSSKGDQDARRICEENCHIMAADKCGAEYGISFSNCTESDVNSNNEPDSSMMQQQQQLKICETRENSCSQQQNLIQEEEEEETEYELLAEALNRDLNCLVDPAASVRSAALLRLQSTLFSCVKSDDKGSCELVEEEHHEPPDQAQVQLRSKHSTLCWAAEELIVKPLLRRFADSSEKCRQLSITILHQYSNLHLCLVSLQLFVASLCLSLDLEVDHQFSNTISTDNEDKCLKRNLLRRYNSCKPHLLQDHC